MLNEFEAITRLLDENNIEYKIHEHEPVYRAEDAAKVRGFDLKSGVKSLVFRVEREGFNDFILVLVPGDRRVDSKKLAEIVKAKNVKLASPEEVVEKTGCEIGSCHPFGNLTGMKTYMDDRILENKIVAFNAGLHTMSITLDPKDIVKVVDPVLCDLSK